MLLDEYRRQDGDAPRAIVVDDEAPITELISTALAHESWEVRTADTAEAALALAETFDPDVAVLDILLPDINGITLLSRLRQLGYTFPVLFLTALDSVDARVTGLTAGGDDYVTKPFSVEEVAARVRSLVRRSTARRQDPPSPVLRVGDLTLNEDSFEVHRGDTEIQLTSTEFELLRFLMRNPGRVLSREQIRDRVWSYGFSGKLTVVELYISYLRKKIDTPERQPMIHTVRKAGYVLKAPEAEQSV